MEHSLTAFDIYFGSFPVEFARVDGGTVPFILREWSEDSTPAAVAKALARNYPQSPFDGAVADVVEAAIPALDFVRHPQPEASESHPDPSKQISAVASLPVQVSFLGYVSESRPLE